MISAFQTILDDTANLFFSFQINIFALVEHFGYHVFD